MSSFLNFYHHENFILSVGQLIFTMDFEQYVSETRSQVTPLTEGEKFIVASVRFDEIFVEAGKKAYRSIFVDAKGNTRSNLGSVVLKQAQFLEGYFAKGGGPVEIELANNTAGKREYWVLTHNGKIIPSAE